MAGEVEVTEHGQDIEPAKAAALEQQHAVERSLFRTVILRAALSVPVGIVIVGGLVTLAVHNQHPNWGVWLGVVAGGVGALAGAFFGALFAFITKSHVLDELAEHARGSGPS